MIVFNNLVCVGTCRDRCGNFNIDRTCQCDLRCERLGDCCVDFKAECSTLRLQLCTRRPYFILCVCVHYCSVLDVKGPGLLIVEDLCVTTWSNDVNECHCMRFACFEVDISRTLRLPVWYLKIPTHAVSIRHQKKTSE